MGIWSQASWAKPTKLTETQMMAQDIKGRIAASKRNECDVFSCRKPVGSGNNSFKVHSYGGTWILVCPSCESKVRWLEEE